MNDVLDIISVALIALAAIPATAFVVGYLFRPWRSSDVGKALLTAEVSVAALIDVSILFWIFGDDIPGAHLVQALVFAAILVGQVALCVVLWRTRESRR